MADRHQPRPPHVIADDAAVAAGGHDGVLDAARLEDVDAAIDRVAFADSAQVDAHARMLEAHRVVRLIEEHVAPVDRRQRVLDLRLGGMDVLGVVVEVADARVGDVEGAFGDLRVVGGQLDEVEQLLVDLHRLAVGALVDLRQLAFGLVVAHQLIDAAHLGHHRIDGRIALDRHRSAHSCTYTRVPMIASVRSIHAALAPGANPSAATPNAIHRRIRMSILIDLPVLLSTASLHPKHRHAPRRRGAGAPYPRLRGLGYSHDPKTRARLHGEPAMNVMTFQGFDVGRGAGGNTARIAASSPRRRTPARPVTCNDGSTSPHGGRGACSGHGGINKSASGAATHRGTSPRGGTGASGSACEHEQQQRQHGDL